LGHEFDLSGSRDIIGHVTWPSDSPWAISYCWSIKTKPPRYSTANVTRWRLSWA